MPPIKEHYVVKHLKTGKYEVKWVLKGVRPYWNGYKVLKGGPYDEATAHTLVEQAMKLKEGMKKKLDEGTEEVHNPRPSVRPAWEAKRRKKALEYSYKDVKKWWDSLKPVVQERYAGEYYLRARNLSKDQIRELHRKYGYDW